MWSVEIQPVKFQAMEILRKTSSKEQARFNKQDSHQSQTGQWYKHMFHLKFYQACTHIFPYINTIWKCQLLFILFQSFMVKRTSEIVQNFLE